MVPVDKKKLLLYLLIMISAKRIVKPDKVLAEKILSITKKQHIDNKNDLSGGFLTTEDYGHVIASSSYTYVDDVQDPTYVSIFFTPGNYIQEFGNPPVKDLENLNYNYVTVKNPDKKTNRKQYEDFFTSMAEQEKSINPEGFWGLIAETIDDVIANDSSIKIHTSLGLKKIHEYSKKDKNMVSGKKIRWGVYVKIHS